MKKYFSLLLLIAISLVFFTGCVSELVVPENGIDSPESEGSENPFVGTGSGKGSLKIYLTNSSGGYKDPPGSFDEEYLAINIKISRIEGHIAGDEEEEETEGKGEGYWETLMSWEPGYYEVDLMNINISVLLASLNLELKKYTQLRIFLDAAASLVLLRGSEEVTEPLEIPSSAQTGIKLNHPFEIAEDMVTKLTILFDAEKSVVKKGNGEYFMKPVIGLSSQTYSDEEFANEIGFGSVSGKVFYYVSTETSLLELGGANIELTGGSYIFVNTPAPSAVTEADGSFVLDNVPADTYILNVSKTGYSSYSGEIVVDADTDTPVGDIVLLSEEPGGISGTVKDSVTTNPIEGATVTATLSGGSTYYVFESSVETDGSGNFLIEQLPVGSYDLAISAAEYFPDSTSHTAIGVTEGTTNPYGTINLIHL